MSAGVLAFPVRSPADDWYAEATAFTYDVFDHEEAGRLEIDPFDFERYVALGWIRETETRPYYDLTPNGEDVYRKFYRDVAKQIGCYWRDEDYYYDGDEDDDDEE